MKKLKSGLRFNASSRAALAVVIAGETCETRPKELQDLKKELTSEITKAYWANTTLSANYKTFDPAFYLNGEFPVVSVLNVIIDNVRHTIQTDKVALPFAVYMDQPAAFDKINTDDLTARMTDFLKQDIEHQIEFKGIVTKIETYLKDFNSPAKLAEAAPDFAGYFPDSYFDDTTEEVKVVSLDDILQG